MKHSKLSNLKCPTKELEEKFEVITQPNAALSLREIIQRFSEGDTSVASHLPCDDFTTFEDDKEFFEGDDTGHIPIEPEDRLDAEEFIVTQNEVMRKKKKQESVSEEEVVNDSKEEVKEVSND